MNNFLYVSDNPATPKMDPDLSQVKIHSLIRQIPISRWKHMRGYHPVREGHEQIAFESRLEASFISLMAMLPELVSIKSQPVTVSFVHNGFKRRYTPDFSVTLSSVPAALQKLGFKKKTLVEVKPSRKAAAIQAMLATKFAALAMAMKLPAVLVTENTIASLMKEVGHGA